MRTPSAQAETTIAPTIPTIAINENKQRKSAITNTQSQNWHAIKKLQTNGDW